MQHNELKKNSIGIFSLVFLVVAAASPLTGLVGALPIAIVHGSGSGIPSIYIISGIILLMFSVGFITMSRYMTNAGAFYAYISKGLGSSMGVSGFCVAMLAYSSIQIAIAAMFGLFCKIFIFEIFGLDLPWWLYTCILLLVVMYLGVEKIEIGSRILGFLMVLEVSIVLLACIISTVQLSTSGNVEFSSFTPTVALQGHIGISLVFAVAGYIGFESTAIYSEESINPKRTIPIATFIAVMVIMLFFAFCSWSLVQYYGSNQVIEVAGGSPEYFVFNMASHILGKWSSIAINILLITSLFAATQAFHNNISRYLFVMARDGVIWSKLAKVHSTKQSPYIASLWQSVFMIILLIILATTKQRPMEDIFAWGSVITTLAILFLQGFVSISVVLFFRKNPKYQEAKWKVLFLPTASAIIMFFVAFLVIQNIALLSGIKSNLVYIMPVLVFLFALGGHAYHAILKFYFPSKLEKLKLIIASE